MASCFGFISRVVIEQCNATDGSVVTLKGARAGFGLRVVFGIVSNLYTDQRDALHPDVM